MPTVNSTPRSGDILDELINEAIKLRDERDLKAAYSLMAQAISDHPSSPAAWGIMADLCWRMGELPKAIRYFEHTTRLSPKSELASLGLFHTLVESGNGRMAFHEMERFLQHKDSQEYRKILKGMKSDSIPNIENNNLKSESGSAASKDKALAPVKKKGVSILWLEFPLVMPPGHFCHFSWDGDSFRIRDYVLGVVYHQEDGKLTARDKKNWLESRPSPFVRDTIWNRSAVGITQGEFFTHPIEEYDWWATTLLYMTAHPLEYKKNFDWFDQQRFRAEK
jgi:tetratricopeptide (TPR) repeat protein